MHSRSRGTLFRMEPNFQSAARLDAITQRIGYAIWQLQVLEGVSATYAVMITFDPRDGDKAGTAALERAKGKPFGATVTALANAKVLGPSLEPRFKRLLAERNWLVHRSRDDSRNAVWHDSAMAKLLGRVEAIANEAAGLIRAVGDLVEQNAKARGTYDRARVDDIAAALLEQWRAED